MRDSAPESALALPPTLLRDPGVFGDGGTHLVTEQGSFGLPVQIAYEVRRLLLVGSTVVNGRSEPGQEGVPAALVQPDL